MAGLLVPMQLSPKVTASAICDQAEVFDTDASLVQQL